jgi:hypothetical protein
MHCLLAGAAATIVVSAAQSASVLSVGDIVVGNVFWGAPGLYLIDPGTGDQVLRSGDGFFSEPIGLDIDGSGDVGVTDFLAMLGVWGQIGVPADFDGGGVGFTDFLQLLVNWGPRP